MTTALYTLEAQLAATHAAGVHTINHLRAMLFMAGSEDASPSGIARHLGASTAAGTCVMDALVERGLAERLPVRGDRRKYHCSLTAAGFALICHEIAAAEPAAA